MWTSTRWVSVAHSVPQTDRSSCSRLQTRAGDAHQLGEQVELGAGELQLLVVAERPAPVDVDAQRAVDRAPRGRRPAAAGLGGGPGRCPLGAMVDPGARPAEHRVHAGPELARGERLGQEVVGARLEAQEPVDLLVARGDHHDVGVADVADPPAGLDAVDAGQAEVEGDQVGLDLADRLDRRQPGVHGRDLEALGRQRVLEELADVLVVLDDERATLVAPDSFVHGTHDASS